MLNIKKQKVETYGSVSFKDKTVEITAGVELKKGDRYVKVLELITGEIVIESK